MPALSFLISAAKPIGSTDGKGFLGDGRPVRLPFGAVVDSTVLLEVGAVAALVLLWLLLLVAVLTWTRPADVDPRPANADLAGDEPPAVVSLLANRWRLNEDAAEATLIDLAARHWIELRQPGNDPTHTTVHVLPPPNARQQQPLTFYEEQVLAHVQAQAVDNVVPVTALTFRDLDEARSWTQRLHSSVIEDARARGLTRRRFSPALVTLLSSTALLPAGLLALAFMERSGEVVAGLGLGLIGWAGLSALAGRPLGERDTPAGRETAARWLGLKAFLQGDEAFAVLPPAAVTVWDRYLSYGDALGVTRVCSALLDLGMGDRKRVWSSFGGGWHRVRIRYPRLLPRYGATAPATLLRAAVGLVAGGFTVRAFADLADGVPGSRSDLIGDVPLLFGGFVFGYGLYMLVRTGGDLVAPKTLTGEVLWVELWKSKQAKNDEPAVPVVHYFAVDDGTGDRTTAWAIPSEWSGRARPGDVVTIVVRPWTRRVTELTIDSSRASRLAQGEGLSVAEVAEVVAATVPGAAGADASVGSAAVSGALGPLGLAGAVGLSAAAGLAAPAVGSATPDVGSDGSVVGAVPAVGPVVPVVEPVVAAGAGRGGGTSAGADLITVNEVAAALGRPVVSDGARARMSVGPFELITFSDPDQTPLLVMAVARGSAVQLVMRGVRALRGGTPIPGVGDEAWRGPNWVAARHADTMIRMTLDFPTSRPANAPLPADALPLLLTKALSRL
jgi:hypothetical protein